MKLTSFYDYKNYRYFWLNALLLAVLSGLYFLDHPIHGPRGDTVLGYSYGIIGAAGIFYLLWFGVRKRSYRSSATTLKGCLSAHVWLGVSLLFIVPLHCGFKFGCNIHTVAYALMVIVIVSGIWGALNYSTLADKIQSHRGGATVQKLLSQLHLLGDDIRAIANQKSDVFQSFVRGVDFEFKPSIARALFGTVPEPIEKNESSALLSKLPESEHPDGLKLISLVNKKRDLASQVFAETAVIAKMRLWLFIHLPVSIALLVALAIHIFAVFYYR